ncbi:hypothetical protein [Kitasatospora sp. NPDC093558]|uniref:DUF7674 family protein n=1 Tax=Kitasatospora sp. NPDC093558 TaxID=3155201 RepID=UPI00343490F1
MATPPWWDELVGVSAILAAADQAYVDSWRELSADGDAGDNDAADGDPEDDPNDVPPVILRLGSLATDFANHSAEFTPGQTNLLFRLLEDILTHGDEADGTAVATGFFESLLNAWDEGFDLESVWPAVGPESRAYSRAWNEFWGIESPAWMR